MSSENPINLKELKEQIETLHSTSTLLLDVRTPHEYQLLHLKGSINIPIGELLERMDEVKDYKTIITICAHGVRSKKAAGILSDLPCTIMYVNGNIEEWIAMGLPVVQERRL